MGRNWTDQEDTILKQEIEKHGKQWALIAASLPKRTPSQVAARWEKCLNPDIMKGPFTPDEDQLIVDYVQQNGPKSWPRVITVLPHRSPKQCRERWFNHLSPGVLKTPWTAEEDQLIFEQRQKIGPKWSVIAKMLPGRTDNAVKNRWNSSLIKRIIESDGMLTILPDQSHRQYKKTGIKPAPLSLPISTPHDLHEMNLCIPLQIPTLDSPPISPASTILSYGMHDPFISPHSPTNLAELPIFPTATPDDLSLMLSPLGNEIHSQFD